MSPLPEQFSEASKKQLETQFNLFSSFTGKAFESAEKLITLNLDVSKASLEKSSALVRQLMAAKDPRDLFALTKETQSQFDSLLSYGRQLFGIAAGVTAPESASAAPAPALAESVPAPVASKAQAELPITMPAPQVVVVKAPAAEAKPVAKPVAETKPVAVAKPVAEAKPVAVAKPVVEAKPVAEAKPIAEPKPVAKAVSNPEEPKPSAASFPVPSSSKPIAVAPVKPVEAAPPPAPVSGTPAIVAKQAAEPSAKPTRKK